MTTDYNQIARQYQEAKKQPWRELVESYSLLDLVGDVAGKRVLDLACGEGYHTRKLAGAGAGGAPAGGSGKPARVLGIDLSEKMVALAREQESREPLGIEYRQGDARSLVLDEEFDLVAAAYLLNYAKDRAELLAMCRSIAGSLAPGGRFVTINTNPDLYHFERPDYARYGFETRTTPPAREGTPLVWTYAMPSGPVSVENYYVAREIHDDAFRAAGFRTVRWHAPRLSPAAWSDTPRLAALDFWSDFLRQPPVILIECVK